MHANLFHSIIKHSGPIYDAVSDNLGHCFTTSADGFIASWNVLKGEQDKLAIHVDVPCFSLTFNNENNILLAGNRNGGLHFIDLNEQKEVKYITHHNKAIHSLQYSRLNQNYYCGDANGNLSIWDSENFQLKLNIPLSCGKIRNISLTECEKFVAVSAQDGILRIFDTERFNEIVTIDNYEGVNCSLFYGDFIITGGKGARLKIWNWKTGKLIKNIPAHNYLIYDILIFEKHNTLITASFDKSIKLWQLPDLDFIQKIDSNLKGHQSSVNRLCKIDKNHFISVGDDRKILVWNLIDSTKSNY